MKVVVTGGAGFVGSNLVRHLEHVPEVTETVVLDDMSFGFRENLDGARTTIVEGSILDEPLLEEVTAGAEAIVHLAARSSVPRSVAHPLAAHEANATGTVRVLEAARRAVARAASSASAAASDSRSARSPRSRRRARPSAGSCVIDSVTIVLRVSPWEPTVESSSSG